MWLAFALASAVFSGTSAVLAKFGISKVDSDLAVALRSVVILAFAWLTVLITGSWADIGRVEGRALLFPLLSGVTNAFAWLCYFKALRMSSIDKVAAVDKAGITLTIVGGWIVLGEAMTLAKVVSILLILSGALLMIDRVKSKDGDAGTEVNELCKDSEVQESYKRNRPMPTKRKGWLHWSLLSALLTAATTLLSKASVERLDSDLGFAIRTGVMFVIAWTIVLVKKVRNEIEEIDRRSMLFVGLSGLSTALAWLCYFKALAAPSAEAGVVQPIDKLSVLVSVLLARVVFKEKLKGKTWLGLAVLTAGILVLLL